MLTGYDSNSPSTKTLGHFGFKPTVRNVNENEIKLKIHQMIALDLQPPISIVEDRGFQDLLKPRLCSPNSSYDDANARVRI